MAASSEHSAPAPLGAILAGGASRRFGAPKALAEVGGISIIRRIRGALAAVLPETIVISGQPELFADLGLRIGPDDEPGLGPLGGVRTALRLAGERGRPAAFCVGCDLPFISPALLRLLLEHAVAHPGHVVLPESRGRRGVEPLCAVYPREAAGAVEALLAAEERRLVALLDISPVHRVPLAEVERAGDPDVLFFNVNTADDLSRANHIARDLEHARA